MRANDCSRRVQETALGRQPQSDPLTSRHENVLHHVCPCITEASVLRPKGREPMPQRWFIRNACTDPLTGRQPHSCGHQRPDGHVTETVGHIPEFGGHDAETGGPVGPKYATWDCGSGRALQPPQVVDQSMDFAADRINLHEEDDHSPVATGHAADETTWRLCPLTRGEPENIGGDNGCSCARGSRR